MVKNFDNICGHRFEGVFLLPDFLGKISGFPMASEVDQKEVVLLSEVAQLLMPHGRTPPCAMDKNDPLAAFTVYEFLIIQQEMLE